MRCAVTVIIRHKRRSLGPLASSDRLTLMIATDQEFEDEVRRIARLLWPAAEFGGALMEDGRERDGVFVGDEFVHLVECTVSRSKKKAAEDSEKLAKLIRRMDIRYPSKNIKGWFVT